MEAHHLVGSTHQFTADEHRRHARVTPKPEKSLLDLPPSRNLIHLVDCGVHPKLGDEESLDGVAHAAGAPAEDHHGPL